MFSQIKDRGTIDPRLDGKTVNAKRGHLQILTRYEEKKSRCQQGVSKRQFGDLTVDILKIRDYCNSKYCGGHKFVKLSQMLNVQLRQKGK